MRWVDLLGSDAVVATLALPSGPAVVYEHTLVGAGFVALGAWLLVQMLRAYRADRALARR